MTKGYVCVYINDLSHEPACSTLC